MQKKADGDEDDYFNRPNNLRELLLTEHFHPFLMQYIKQMTNECIELYLHPLCQRYLDAHDCDYADLSHLNAD